MASQSIRAVAEALEAETAATDPPRRWFYSQGGQRFGPVTAAELRVALRMGFLGPTNSVRCGREGQWHVVGLLLGLAGPHSESPSAHASRPRSSSSLPAPGDPAMHAAATMASSHPPVPPPSSGIVSCDHPQDALPSIYVSRRPGRHRARQMPFFEMVFAIGCLAIVGYVAYRLVERVTNPDAARRTVARATTRVMPATGGGRRPKSAGTEQRRIPTPQKTVSSPGSPRSERDAESLIRAGLKACREGLFDVANDYGVAATAVAPDDLRGFAIQVLAAYAPQYSKLADEAVERMNGSVEVDLGKPHGIGAFVENTHEQIVFIANGRHVRYTPAEFNNLFSVRFRVARAFLDNGKLPGCMTCTATRWSGASIGTTRTQTGDAITQRAHRLATSSSIEAAASLSLLSAADPRIAARIRPVVRTAPSRDFALS